MKIDSSIFCHRILIFALSGDQLARFLIPFFDITKLSMAGALPMSFLEGGEAVKRATTVIPGRATHVPLAER